MPLMLASEKKEPIQEGYFLDYLDAMSGQSKQVMSKKFCTIE